MISKFKVILLFIILTFALYGCESETKKSDPPNLTITSGDINLDYTTELYKWNGTVYDLSLPFSSLMNDNNNEGSELKYLPLGSTIDIKFESNPPDKVILNDYVLKKDGTPYGSQPAEVEITNTDSIYQFRLEPNLFSMVSSDSRDYEKGASIRGFQLICTWGEDECKYSFIINSDASQETMLPAPEADYIVPSAPIDTSDLNIYWQYEITGFSGEENAILALYVNAEKDDNEQFLFDDRNEWALVLTYKDDKFNLLDRQFLQLGDVSCSVFFDFNGENPIPHILTTIQQTASYEIFEFIYDSSDNRFLKNTVYDMQNINFITESF